MVVAGRYWPAFSMPSGCHVPDDDCVQQRRASQLRCRRKAGEAAGEVVEALPRAAGAVPLVVCAMVELGTVWIPHGWCGNTWDVEVGAAHDEAHELIG